MIWRKDRRARRTYTRYAVLTAWRALMANEYAASFAQVREARKLTSTLAVCIEIGKFLPRARRAAP